MNATEPRNDVATELKGSGWGNLRGVPFNEIGEETSLLAGEFGDHSINGRFLVFPTQQEAEGRTRATDVEISGGLPSDGMFVPGDTRVRAASRGSALVASRGYSTFDIDIPRCKDGDYDCQPTGSACDQHCRETRTGQKHNGAPSETHSPLEIRGHFD